jgi:hypothetical protein
MIGGLWHGNINIIVLKEARKFPKEALPTTCLGLAWKIIDHPTNMPDYGPRLIRT